MINNPIIFYIAAALLITFALTSLFDKNIIRSLLSAIVVFFCGAIFFYVLGSEYNAIIQAAIYGLAVPIIIGISIMFTTEGKNSPKTHVLSFVTLLAAGIFLSAFIFIILISLAIIPETFHMIEIPQVNFFDVISSFAKGIFINYVWGFEIISILLTIVIAGFTLYKRGRIE